LNRVFGLEWDAPCPIASRSAPPGPARPRGQAVPGCSACYNGFRPAPLNLYPWANCVHILPGSWVLARVLHAELTRREPLASGEAKPPWRPWPTAHSLSGILYVIYLNDQLNYYQRLSPSQFSLMPASFVAVSTTSNNLSNQSTYLPCDGKSVSAATLSLS